VAGGDFAWNVELLGYHDLQGRPGFKLAMQESGGRFYLYAASLWHNGWSILEVTDPRNPKLERWVEGPPNTQCAQIQVADRLMVTGIGPIIPGWGDDPDGPPPEEGVIVWDVSDPVDPKKLGHWQTGAAGTHRNFYGGGRYVHTSITQPGFVGEIYGILDIDDPANPKLVGRWWWPGQHVAAGETFSERDEWKRTSGRPLIGAGGHVMNAIWHHGPPYVEGDRAYCAYARAGMPILDISDVTAPQLVGVFDVYPPLGSSIAVHTAVPVGGRRLAYVNSEALRERCDEPPAYAAIVDIEDERDPTLISLFPVPLPPEGYGFSSFCHKGGRFGPHNQHHPQAHPSLEPSGDYVYLTYFNAGLQIFDVSDPKDPRIAGHYVPADPETRHGPLPSDLVVQLEDVLVDRRGYIYTSEKNSGLRIFEFTPHA
jgi:hypothetical protein